MVDIALTQAIVKRMNRWYRSRSKPHGNVDHNHRGIRLSYNSGYRLIVCLMSLLLLAAAYALYFVPGIFANKSRVFILVIKIAWAGLLVIVLLAPIQVLREFVVVTDDGLLKSDLFGRLTRMDWSNISRVQVKVDENEVIFFTAAGQKLKTSLCYNGWQDFIQTSAKHLNPFLQAQVLFATRNIKNVVC